MDFYHFLCNSHIKKTEDNTILLLRNIKPNI